MNFNHSPTNILEKDTERSLEKEFIDKSYHDSAFIKNLNLHLLIFKEGIRTSYLLSKTAEIQKGSIVGFMSLYSIKKEKLLNAEKIKESEKKERVTQIYSIWLHPNHRGYGLGTLLMHCSLINSKYPVISSENNGIAHIQSWCKLLAKNSHVSLLDNNLREFPYQMKDSILPIDQRHKKDISLTENNYYFLWSNSEESKKISRKEIQSFCEVFQEKLLKKRKKTP